MTEFIWIEYPYEGLRNSTDKEFVQNYIMEHLGLCPMNVKIKRVKRKGEEIPLRFDVIFTIKEADTSYAYEKLLYIKKKKPHLKIEDYRDYKARERLLTHP